MVADGAAKQPTRAPEGHRDSLQKNQTPFPVKGFLDKSDVRLALKSLGHM